MSVLFEPMPLKGIELKNRFVRSATYDGYADQRGHVTDDQIAFFKDLARGGTGLIVTGICHVHPSGQTSPIQNSVATDDCIPGLRKLSSAVHQMGAKIAIQLFHAGREGARFLGTRNLEAVGPSFVEDDPHFDRPYRSMTGEEIADVVNAFGDAARRVREAGFDAVQIHGAHAYLLSQFLSPYLNRRKDQWGGTLENRLRLHREIVRDIRAKVGEDYPLLIKLGVQDGFQGGLAFNEGASAARSLAQWGVDAIEVSSGLRGNRYEGTEFRTKISRPEREAYFRKWCSTIKGEVDIPVMMVGGLRTFSMMEEVIEKKEADFVSLCRPFIREPFIVNQWRKEPHYRPTCISCNQCLNTIFKGNRLQCMQEAKGKKKVPKSNPYS
ncbi:MAG: NADH:flavin oxidoreductase [Deltaproteobacteria bacterium]|nr:NADH:flavin oxidoreductase [Deltaproteobacteria bacterium]